MNNVTIKFTCGCLWCDKEMDYKQAIGGKMFCSKKCLNDMKKEVPQCGYSMEDVQK